MSALLLLALALLVACDDSPTAPETSAMIFEGVLECGGEGEFRFMLDDHKSVRVTVDSLELTPAPAPPEGETPDPNLTGCDAYVVPPEDPFVGLRLGRLSSDGACNPTYTNTVREEFSAVFGLAPFEYCVRAGAPAYVSQTATLAYRIRIRIE